MAGRFERKCNEMLDLEYRLREENRHQDANIVANFRRSAVTVHTTLKTIHRDNMVLRKRLGMSSFLDSSGPPLHDDPPSE